MEHKLGVSAPNSPDLNTLDFGHFNAIQSLQYQMAPANVDELIKCVEDSIWQQPIETTENIFLTLQKCMECVMLHQGDNKYRLPRIGKGKMRRSLQEMPKVLPCSQEAIDSALEVI